MCGISGMLLTSSEPEEAKLRGMGERLYHRGPDNFAIYRDARIALAHNRLSILDLSSKGNQPFCDDRYILIYNGEIYNYLEIKTELTKKGVRFEGTSDTEVLFALLVREGIERALHAVRGMFAFCFYDRYTGDVFLCRDRLGIKPLFWSHNQEGLFWASEVKALMAVLEIEPDPIQTLYAITGVADKLNQKTVFKDVYHVPPGHYLHYKQGPDGGRPEVIEYFNLLEWVDESYYSQLELMSLQDAADHFSSLLDRSVQQMLMSDVPMGVFVSGGIDSGLIAWHGAQHDDGIELFTANILGQLSEYPDARLLSQTLSRPLHDVRFQPEMMISLWADVTYHYEAPVVTHTNAIPFSQVAGLAAQHGVKPVLTGEGADELFYGYPKLLTRRFDRLLKTPLNLLKSAYGFIPGLGAYVFPEAGPTILGFMETLVQNFERQMYREEGHKAYHFLKPAQAAYQYLTIQMLKEGLVALLYRNDRMGMMAGIESRFPFLDEEILRFAINLPAKFKTGRSTRFHNYKHPFLIDKAIVRKAAEKRLPAKLVYKKKDGFPMYGHQYVRVKPGYFRCGYAADILSLSSAAEDHMIRSQNPYFVAKLVSVDVFGRIFAWKESPDAVSEQLQKWVEIEV